MHSGLLLNIKQKDGWVLPIRQKICSPVRSGDRVLIRSENVWTLRAKQSFVQFRGPQSYLLLEFLGESL